MTEGKPRTVIAHGHIFKNAGTTFDWSLRRNFSQDFVDHRDNDQMRKNGASCLANVLKASPNLRAIASHHLYRWMPFTALPDVSITPCFFIRHPIERVRSVYIFERGQKAETPGAVHAKKLNFKDYIAWRMEHKGGGVVMNYQTKYCSGRKGATLSDTFIARTAEFLATTALTGIVDRFDESMVYFEEALQQNFPGIDLSYIRQNISGNDRPALSVNDRIEATIDELGEVAEVLKENNRADAELYSLANRALDEQIKAIPGFKKKLESFRRRCNKLGAQR